MEATKDGRDHSPAAQEALPKFNTNDLGMEAELETRHNLCDYGGRIIQALEIWGQVCRIGKEFQS